MRDPTGDPTPGRVAAADLEGFTSHWRNEFLRHLCWLSDGRPVIHLGYCGHANPGDNAISVAEDRLLHEAGIRVAARVSDLDLELRFVETLRFIRTHPGLPILFRGGGTLNDVYRQTGERHAWIIEAFPDRRILEGAVGIHFSDPAAATDYRRAVARHPEFRLLARDESSVAWARTHLDGEVFAMPDAVLTGTPRRVATPGTGRIGLVVRQDLEADPGRGVPPAGARLPWMDEPRAWQEPRLIASRVRRRLTGPTKVTSLLEPLAARGRVARVVDLLSDHDAVVADRLHVALWCIMLGIPVAVVDNVYGKISSTFTTWNLEEIADAKLVDTFDDALATARAWLD